MSLDQHYIFNNKEPEDKQIPVETEFEFEEYNFWWPHCIKDGCPNTVCLGLSEEYCYPHSAWWRRFTRYWNMLITFLTTNQKD